MRVIVANMITASDADDRSHAFSSFLIALASLLLMRMLFSFCFMASFSSSFVVTILMLCRILCVVLFWL